MRSWLRLLLLLTPFVVLAGLQGGVEDKLDTQWLFNEDSRFADDERLLRESFGHDVTAAILLEGPAAELNRKGARLSRALRRTGRVETLSPWEGAGAAPALRRPRAGLLVAEIDTDLREYQQASPLIGRAIREAVRPPVSAKPLGLTMVGDAIGDESFKASHEGERLAAPVLVLVLLLVLRAPIAAAIPLLLGVLTVQAARGFLSVSDGTLDLDPLALSMATTMGLALGVDYGLLMVARFREELRRGVPPPEAAAATRRTAGRTVVFAALALLFGLGALMVLVAGDPVAQSFAFGAVLATVLAVTICVAVVPVALRAIGHGVDRWAIRSRPSQGRWLGLARRATRRPGPVAAAVFLVLVLLALPVRGLEMGGPDPRQLPSGSQGREAAETLRRVAGAGWGNPFEIVLAGPANRFTPSDAARFERRLARLPGVASVFGVRELSGSPARGARPGGVPRRPASAAQRRVAGRFVRIRDGRLLTRTVLVPRGYASDPEVADLHDRVREEADGFARRVGATAGVAGAGPWLVDIDRTASARLPLVVAVLSLLTFTILTVLFRAPLVALVAVVLNLLTMSVCFGALTLLAPTGLLGDADFLDSVATAVIFTVIFGLSIDYEVFLLTRIREAWQAHGDPRAAIDHALERTGGVLTGAAIILGTVFVAFASTDVAPLRQVGVGLAIAIAIDATVVRLILLPAVMSLLGARAWSAPRWLDRALPTVGVEPAAEPEPAPGRTER